MSNILHLKATDHRCQPHPQITFMATPRLAFDSAHGHHKLAKMMLQTNRHIAPLGRDIASPILQMEKQRLREVKEFARGQKSGICQGQVLRLASCVSKADPRLPHSLSLWSEI